MHNSYWQIGDNSKVWDIPGHAWVAEWFTDPCWNIVYTNDENGTALTGYDIADLRDEALNGHKIRVIYNRQQMECSEVLLKDDHVCCACFNKFSKSGIDTFPSDVYHSPEIICSNGNINRLEIAVGSNEVVNGTMEENAEVTWSVDVRQWKKVASIRSSGEVTQGSKQALKYAIENGAEVRYKVKFDLDSPYWAIVEPDQVEVNGDELAAMVIRSISMQPDDDFVFKYTQERPCLRPSIMATTGRMDILKLTLGEHETRNHYSMQYETEWFVNL